MRPDTVGEIFQSLGRQCRVCCCHARQEVAQIQPHARQNGRALGLQFREYQLTVGRSEGGGRQAASAMAEATLLGRPGEMGEGENAPDAYSTFMGGLPVLLPGIELGPVSCSKCAKPMQLFLQVGWQAVHLGGCQGRGPASLCRPACGACVCLGPRLVEGTGMGVACRGCMPY